ncbi:unnamed protein product [Calicophoron daubneyi]|uniref:RecQ-mediated genome instability protein 1 C-terminal OB-fold domain-containing protein n=1 Tax=Calicophoron daubneyi TaxID=300641 RepID=A0AAV2TRH8_CALDB
MLGGYSPQVDELLESSDGDLMYQVGLLLAKKLSIPLSEDGSLPSWFPRIRKPAQESDATDGQQQNPISAVTTSQVGPSLSNPCKTVTAQGSGLTLSAVLRPPSTPSLEPWNAEVDEDALITQAAQNLEKQLLTSYTTSNSTASESLAGKNKVTQAAGISRDRAFLGEAEQDVEQEVDPDVFASVMEELENEKLVNLPAVDNQTTAKRTNKVCAQPKRTLSPKIPSASCSSASFEQNRQSRDTKAVRQTVLKLSARKESDGIKRDPPNPVPTPSTSSIRGDESRSSEPDDLLPPAPKRKPWERRRSSVTTELKADNITSPPAADSQTDIQGDQKTDYKFTPFCYIEDMYKELLTVDSGSIVRKRRVYTIRGLLINLLSSLEHHQGSRWTLAARLADGSAVVDVDISSELLTEWIGLTAAESESLRQMSRVNASAPGTNSVAAQEAQKHLLRLKNAITNFRARLSNLSGLFDITSPSATSIGSLSTDSDKPLRPVVVGFRPLSGTWLKELHARVQDRWGLE